MSVVDWADAPTLDRAWIKGRDVHVIGAGAIGAPCVLALVRAGIPVHVYDDDVVEAKNLRNQVYLPEHIGLHKVEALRRMTRTLWPREVLLTPHIGQVGTDARLRGFVILAVDSLLVRYTIFGSCLMNNKEVPLVCDGRMGAWGGRVYGINPNNQRHVAFYCSNDHMHGDKPEIFAACTATPNAYANAAIVSARMIQRLGAYLHYEQGCTDQYSNYIGWEEKPETRSEHAVLGWED